MLLLHDEEDFDFKRDVTDASVESRVSQELIQHLNIYYLFLNTEQRTNTSSLPVAS